MQEWSELMSRVRAMDRGAVGVVEIDDEESHLSLSEEGCSLRLTDAERAVLEGCFAELTRREREVIFALCGGGTNEGMADRLCIALPTLRTHLMRLNQKLGTASKGDVIRLVAAHLLDAYRSRRIDAAPEGGSPRGEVRPAV